MLDGDGWKLLMLTKMSKSQFYKNDDVIEISKKKYLEN